MDAIAVAGGLHRKIPGQVFRRYVGGDARRVEAGPGRGNRLAVNIRGEDLHHEILFHGGLALRQQDGDRVSFFARRTAG